jgi:class 3 adenylate cyclase
MTAVRAEPALASVIVLIVQEFARKPVAEQDRLKTRIEKLVAQALHAIGPAQRIVLDAPQGMAVALLGRPRHALEFAERIQAASAADLPLCIGINHGPVTIAEDAQPGEAVVGDGIAAGMTLAKVATPGRLIASGSFHEALQADSPAIAARLGTAGAHTDAQVRTHALYTLDPRAGRARRQRLAAAGALTCAGILALGVLGRTALQGGLFPAAPAIIEFHVSPRGDIYIDGVLKGNAPPVRRIEVSPGPHTIEVRNSPHPPFKIDIDPAPKEELTVRHTFVSSKSAAAKGSKRREPSLRENAREGWRSFRKSVGF